jgi:hypothetical protein
VSTCSIWLKNDVVEVVELLVLVVVEVELVVVVEVELVVVLPPPGVVVVVVLDDVVVGGTTEVVVFCVVAVMTCCCMNGSLLWKLEYASAGAAWVGCWLASASDCAVVDTLACRRVLEVDALPPRPMQPARRTADPPTRITAARRCRCR